MDNNEALARIYHPSVRQIIIVYPIVWCHEAGGGDWYVRDVLHGPRYPIAGARHRHG